MANSREIQRRIRSVGNMSQITRAMEMVSAVKMRRAQQRVAELLRTGRHPQPSGDWPALPWPPF